MRQFYPFFLVALLLVPWVCKAYPYSTSFTFSSEYPLCYNYTDKPVANSPTGTPLIANEVIMAVLVRDTRADQSTDPFAIDAAGQVVVAAGLPEDQVVVCDNLYAAEGSPQHQAWRIIGQTAGLPETPYTTDSGEKRSVITATASKDVAGSDYSAEYVYQPVCIYLVVLDTRNGDMGSAAGAPKRVVRYALRKCADVNDQPFGASHEVFVGKTVSGCIFAELPGLEVQTVDDETVFLKDSWKDVVAIQSWTKADGTVLKGEDLEAFLKPGMTAFASATDAAGGETFTLAATSEAEDITYYTLYTKEALSDAAWTPFNTVMADKENEMREKGLDNYLQKDYTRCRLNGEGPLTIPLIPGDTGRFYLLRATGNE